MVMKNSGQRHLIIDVDQPVITVFLGMAVCAPSITIIGAEFCLSIMNERGATYSPVVARHSHDARLTSSRPREEEEEGSFRFIKDERLFSPRFPAVVVAKRSQDAWLTAGWGHAEERNFMKVGDGWQVPGKTFRNCSGRSQGSGRVGVRHGRLAKGARERGREGMANEQRGGVSGNAGSRD